MHARLLKSMNEPGQTEEATGRKDTKPAFARPITGKDRSKRAEVLESNKTSSFKRSGVNSGESKRAMDLGEVDRLGLARSKTANISSKRAKEKTEELEPVCPCCRGDMGNSEWKKSEMGRDTSERERDCKSNGGSNSAKSKAGMVEPRR